MDIRNKKLLDSIIEYLNPRFNKIENEISSLKSDVATINKYISTESKVKEITANKLVEDFFNTHNTYYKKISLKYFFNRKGKEITELDGCYVIHPKDYHSEKSFTNIVNRKYNRITNEKAVADMLKINKTDATSYTPTSKLMIVECKNLFNKYMKVEYIIPKKKTNIHDFIKKYKNKTFLLKNDKVEIEVKLLKKRRIFIKSKLDFYSIFSLSNEFHIDFFHEKPSFENVYIPSINKSDKYSGSEVVKFVIEFLKSFKQVKKAYLYDAATINCKNSNDTFSLSLYKLITSYVGFYQKYGFRLVIDYGKEEDITNNMVLLAIIAVVFLYAINENIIRSHNARK